MYVKTQTTGVARYSHVKTPGDWNISSMSMARLQVKAMHAKRHPSSGWAIFEEETLELIVVPATEVVIGSNRRTYGNILECEIDENGSKPT